MPLVLDRAAVVDLYAEAADHGWVLANFNSENPTCTEAILAASARYGLALGHPDLPVIVGLTNLYDHRAQTPLYSHCGDWRIGLRMFLDDLKILCGPGSPYADLRVMIHLDHVQWDVDAELLEWDFSQFSSLMYDASTLPFAENIRRTAAFVAAHGSDLFIEGACDEITEGEGSAAGSDLTTPEQAARYAEATGVDLMVANVGTEHRAAAATRKYHRDLARQIAAAAGPKLCLHGTSSVPAEQVRTLFADGVRKVNVWTALERDSSPALFEAMLRHADGIVGRDRARAWRDAGLLGPAAPVDGPAALACYTTTFRQDIVFHAMQDVVTELLEIWYPG